MTNEKTSIPAMAAKLIELRQVEETALKAFHLTEITYGVRSEHPAKDEAQRVVSAASDKVLSLLD